MSEKKSDRVIAEKPSRLLGIALPIVILGYAVDQIVKKIAEGKLQTVGEAPFIPGILKLTYVENTGAAFSILQGKMPFFITVTSVVVIAVVWLMLRGYFKRTFSFVAISFVLAGALGNLVDRIRQGYVVDMFEPEFMRFAIFNVADIFLTLGGIALVLYVLFHREKQDGKQN